jgi:formylglycine-generating enzyme required for sulfatase activity
MVLALFVSLAAALGAANGDLSEPRQLPANANERPAAWRSETRAIRVKTAGSTELELREIVCYTNELGMDFVLIQPGEFTMGGARGEPGREAGEGPQHPVRITQAFYMGAHEVTQQQYAEVMGKNPSRFTAPKNPVEQVSWNDAVEFCARLSKKDGRTYRLPTEAEWEYACRAGSTEAYCYGGDPGQVGDYAWDKRNSDGKTHEVGLALPNAWGLYDVHGNVWEWCQDWYGGYKPGPDEDPVGPTSGTYRIVRGGSWFDYPWPLRCASRGRNSPAIRADDQGFRVVCVPGPLTATPQPPAG